MHFSLLYLQFQLPCLAGQLHNQPLPQNLLENSNFNYVNKHREHIHNYCITSNANLSHFPDARMGEPVGTAGCEPTVDTSVPTITAIMANAFSTTPLPPSLPSLLPLPSLSPDTRMGEPVGTARREPSWDTPVPNAATAQQRKSSSSRVDKQARSGRYVRRKTQTEESTPREKRRQARRRAGGFEIL